MNAKSTRDATRDFCIHDEHNVIGFYGPFRWLSNFEQAKVIFEEMEFDNVEAAFQAAKMLDREERKKFQHMEPGRAKKAGRKVPLRADWEAANADGVPMKDEIMLRCVLSKFTENPNHRRRLLETGTKHLEERNSHHDTIWGTNLQGSGQNRLGKILMRVRELLRGAEAGA